MIINALLLVIILLCLGGIIFIISQKFFSLSNIDLDQIPKERTAKVKKDLLEKKMSRQARELVDKIKVNANLFKNYSKKVYNRLKKIIKNNLHKFKKT